MRPILVIEPSATLRHAVRKLLAPRGHEIVLSSTYTSGLQQLRESSEHYSFAAVILGFPLDAHAQTDELLSALKSPDYADTGVLILAHNADPMTFHWVARRERAALLLWDDYTDCVDCLHKLILPDESDTAGEHVTPDITRVLFVDDSRTVRMGYERLLFEHGYYVETASNIVEAMEKARKGHFDIAIVDYFMPGGNGDLLCQQLREDPRTRDITTAIITGTYLDDVIRDSLRAGAVECMFKNEAKELFLTRLAAMSRSVQIRKSIDTERQRLASILGSVGDGVYGVDTDGLITFMNPAATEILGIDDPESVIGMKAHTLFHYAREDGKAVPVDKCFLHQAYASGDELRGWEAVFWKQEGEPTPVECTVFPLRIEGRLEGSVVAFRDVSERKLLEKELLWQANHDALTRLNNRHCFERNLEHEVSRIRRSDEKSALLYIDLDRFKYINDTAGHAAGDQLLVEVGQRLQARLRESDHLARLGGDEFAIILRNVNQQELWEVADGFRAVLEGEDFVYNGKVYNIRASTGIAVIDNRTQSPGEVLANADIACHIAKDKGRNQTHLYQRESDEKIAMNMELGWSVRLQDALHDNSFVLHYQPIVPMERLHARPLPGRKGELWQQLLADQNTGPMQYEVLLRMVDNRGELISPGAFLPTAERFGLMPQIDAWVLTHAIDELGRLNATGHDVTFTINLSGQTLEPGRLSEIVRRLLEGHRLDPEKLIFEITETSAIENIDAAKELIGNLRAMGCRFALDDFGSGFSSFYHLKHLPVDFIKIDGQFVKGMAADSTDRAIVTSINDIAHSFGKQTIAEFVENPEILGMLQEYGIDFAQGFYISSPEADLPAEHACRSSKAAR